MNGMNSDDSTGVTAGSYAGRRRSISIISAEDCGDSSPAAVTAPAGLLYNSRTNPVGGASATAGVRTTSRANSPLRAGNTGAARAFAGGTATSSGLSSSPSSQRAVASVPEEALTNAPHNRTEGGIASDSTAAAVSSPGASSTTSAHPVVARERASVLRVTSNLSPANSGALGGTSVTSPTTASGGGGSGTGTGTPSVQSRPRPPSLLYRRASAQAWSALSVPRGGAAIAGTAANGVSASTNVYTLQLPGDDGGVEMAAARPLLYDVLRMRETYKCVDKGLCELAVTTAAMSSGSNVTCEGSRNAPALAGIPQATPQTPATQFQPLHAQTPPPLIGPTTLQQVDGVFFWSEEKTPIASWAQFCTDVLTLAACVQHPSCVAASRYRLQVLEEKYHLHRLYNADVEENTDRFRRGGGLFANACRVDNCVGASTAMNAQWLVEYIQRTIDEHGDDVVWTSDSAQREGGGSGTEVGAAAAGSEPQTLERVCELLDFPDPYLLTVEGLGLQPSVNRALPYYDALDPSLNGSGYNSAELLRLFLSVGHRPEQGSYLAGAVQNCLTRNELRTNGAQASEMTLNITGMLAKEWEIIAAWVRTHELDSFRSNQFQFAFPITRWCRRVGEAGGRAGGGNVLATGGTPTTYFGVPLSSDSSEQRDARALAGNDMRASGRGRSLSIFNPGAVGMGGTDSLLAGVSPDEILNYDNYQQLLDHLFLPLFMATLAPEDPKYVDLATLLQHTGSILLTGSEHADVSGSTATTATGYAGFGRQSSGDVGGVSAADVGGPHTETVNAGRRRRPADTPFTEPVSLTYLSYYIWANLCSLNALRRRRGQNTLQLRVMATSATVPNTSSAHDASLLLLSYLIADVVVDGVALDRQPVLQYLYGLHQIGVSMCPLARSSLGTTDLSEHPVARLLWRGLNVSLCTLSPLYYHSTQEPLLEEYTSTSKGHHLAPTDISEMILHSVCMSSFEDDVKSSWIGTGFLREGWRANQVELTSVPTARLLLRHEAWTAEQKLLHTSGGAAPVQSDSGYPLDDATSAARRDVSMTSGRYGLSSSQGRRAGSSSPLGALTGAGGGTAFTGGSPQLQAPYAVLDPAVDFPRTILSGSFERDIQNASLVQALHHALDLRHQYSSLPLPSQPLGSTNAGDDAASNDDTRAGWLASLIRDPQAVLPHPTQSMSWAFKKITAPSGNEKPANGRPSTAAPPSAAGASALSYLHFDEDEWKYKTVEGIIVPHEVHQIPRLPQDMYHYTDFCNHVEEIRHLIDHIRVRDFALRRLQLLEHRFNLHAAVNHSRELGSTAERASHNRDFYQSTKVDNNIRMETGMTARQLLAFIVDKATHNGDDIVSHPKGKEPQTLRQLLSELHITAGSLTVDDLNVQAGATSSDGGAPQNPFVPEGQRQDELLTLLLKTDNQMNGRYFAELTKRTFEELSRDQHTFTESRLPVYGASAEEWALLSHWFDTHGMASSHNQWVVQVPRIYSSLRKAGRVSSFAEYLEHIFEPLWRISLHPNSDPRLFHFINHIAAFDCVEDERRPDMPLHMAMRAPHEWTSEEEPPYNYYLYHLYANLRSLNRFRQRRRFSVFSFRPSCGEAGSIDHLIGGFLLAQSVNYGVRLADSAPLQYLFYLAQIGVTLSPLSNNTKLQLNYLHNPFPQFFRRGLRVSLGTDSPLLYHHTQEPLLEEYSIASKIWKLSANDLSEVARNSVLLSNFSVKFKEEKLGPLYFLSSSAGNDVAKTHLSGVRVAYRFEAYHTEVGFLEYISGQHFHRALLTLAMEAQCKQLCGVDVGSAGSGSTADVADGRTLGSTSGSIGFGSTYRGGDVVGLIDSAPKEADLAQLEAQRARMQRQLWEVTSAVSDLHRQNRLLTAKMAEEKERDQQAAELRRRRIGNKLQDLENLMKQKEVRRDQAPPDAWPSQGLGEYSPRNDTDDTPTVFNVMTSGEALATLSSPLTPGSATGGVAATSVSFVNASVSTANVLSSHVSADNVMSTVRSRKFPSNGNTMAQTRRLLELTESLWRPASISVSEEDRTFAGDQDRPLTKANVRFPPLNGAAPS